MNTSANTSVSPLPLSVSPLPLSVSPLPLSVSPLPLSVWPLLGLSLALVAFTCATVTVSARRGTQIYLAASRELDDATQPVTAQDLVRNRVAVAVFRAQH